MGLKGGLEKLLCKDETEVTVETPRCCRHQDRSTSLLESCGCGVWLAKREGLCVSQSRGSEGLELPKTFGMQMIPEWAPDTVEETTVLDVCCDGFSLYFDLIIPCYAFILLFWRWEGLNHYSMANYRSWASFFLFVCFCYRGPPLRESMSFRRYFRLLDSVRTAWGNDRDQLKIVFIKWWTKLVISVEYYDLKFYVWVSSFQKNRVLIVSFYVKWMCLGRVLESNLWTVCEEVTRLG